MLHPDQDEVVADDHQRVVEVVRHAAGEASQRFELLGLQQRLFDLPPGHCFIVQPVGSGQRFAGAPQRHPGGEEQSEQRRQPERCQPPHLDGPALADLGDLHAGAEVHRVVTDLAESQQPLLVVDRRNTAGVAAGVAGANARHHRTAGRQARRRTGQQRPAGEDDAILAQHGDRQAGLVGHQVAVKSFEIGREQADRDQPQKRPVRRIAALAHVDEAVAGEAPGQGPRDEGAPALAQVPFEIVAVRSADACRHRVVAVAGERPPVRPQHPERLDLRLVAAHRLQLRVQLGLAATDCRSVAIAEGVLHAGQHRIVGVEHLQGMLLRNAQRAIEPQLRFCPDLAVAIYAHSRVREQRQQHAEQRQRTQRRERPGNAETPDPGRRILG
jgi:hypothetical protein